MKDQVIEFLKGKGFNPMPGYPFAYDNGFFVVGCDFDKNMFQIRYNHQACTTQNDIYFATSYIDTFVLYFTFARQAFALMHNMIESSVLTASDESQVN